MKITKTQATVLDNKIKYLENVLTEDINKTALSSNNDKRPKSNNFIETYIYGTSKDLVSEKEEIKCNNAIKRYKK